MNLWKKLVDRFVPVGEQDDAGFHLLHHNRKERQKREALRLQAGSLQRRKHSCVPKCEKARLAEPHLPPAAL